MKDISHYHQTASHVLPAAKKSLFVSKQNVVEAGIYCPSIQMQRGPYSDAYVTFANLYNILPFSMSKNASSGDRSFIFLQDECGVRAEVQHLLLLDE